VDKVLRERQATGNQCSFFPLTCLLKSLPFFPRRLFVSLVIDSSGHPVTARSGRGGKRRVEADREQIKEVQSW